MAATPVEISFTSGVTGMLLLLFDRGADTLLNPTGGGDALTERTNAKGTYTAIVDEAIVGNKRAVIMSAGVAVAVGRVNMADDTAVHYVTDEGDDSVAALAAAGNVSVELINTTAQV